MKHFIKSIFLLILQYFCCALSSETLSVLDKEILRTKQYEIRRKIDERSKELEKLDKEKYDGLYGNNQVAPIYDGVCDFDQFSKNKYRIMWILKEAYDDVKDGKAFGGGWFITDGNDSGDFDYVSGTWKRIAQVSYGIQNKEKKFEKLPKVNSRIRGDSEYGKLLKSIVYINTNKMPGLTTSSNYTIQKNFYFWKSILKEQAQLYKPDVVIFGGTYDFYQYNFSEVFGVNPASPGDMQKYKNAACKGAFVDSNNCLYIDAYHPGYFILSDEEYFNGIMEIVKKWKNKKIK